MPISQRIEYQLGDVLVSGGVTSPTSSTDPRTIRIEIEDQRSGEEMVRLQFDAEQFLALVSGGSVRMTGVHIGQLDRVGKLLHVHSVRVDTRPEADGIAEFLSDVGWATTDVRSVRGGYQVVARYWGDDVPVTA